MTTKEKIKTLIDELPEEKLQVIELLLQPLLVARKNPIPTGNLGLKEPFNRVDLYDEIVAHRY